MSTYTARFSTRVNLTVTLDAEDEEQAGDRAWTLAEEYLRTVYGDHSRGITADATLDGIGAEKVEEVVRPPTDEPRCICGGMYDATGEGDIDYRPDCPCHGNTPEAIAYQESRTTWLDEVPF